MHKKGEEKRGKKALSIIDEKILLSKLQSGDQLAFEVLYDCYFKILYSYALYFVKNQLEAEDIVEDVFIKIWESRDSLVITTSINAYMFQMTRNSCLDYIKSRNIRQSYSKEVQMKIRLDDHLQFSIDPLSHLMSDELIQMIKNEINKLPPRTKRIFKLSRYYQVRNKEIALKEKVSESTVEKSIKKVLDLLSKYL